MDYLLAAHIRVTGGDAAAAELHKVDRALANVGKNTGSGTGTGLSAGLDKAKDSASGFGTAIGQVQTAMVRMATYTGLTALAGGFASAVGGVLDFDQAMTESLAIQSGVTETMRGNMENLAKTIAVDLGMAPKDVAEGFYFLASAGLNVNQQMAALPQVSAFAKAGMMDLEAATEMAYDALSALGMKVDNPAQQLKNLTLLTDELTVAAIRSQGTVGQFGEAIANKAGASMKTFGIDLEEGIGLLAVFADQGIKGKVAGERFSMVIRDIALKSLKKAPAWKDMGIEAYDAAGGLRPLIDIFRDIDKALLPLTDAERTKALNALGFTLKDVGTIQSLLGKSDALAGFTRDLENAGGAAQRVADNQMESLRSKLDQLKAITIVFALDGWEKLQEAGAWLATTFTPALNAIGEALANMADGARPVVETLAQIGGGLVIGALTGLADTLATVFGYLAEHETTARALGAALAAMAGAAVVGRIAGLVDLFGVGFGGAIGNATAAAYGLAAQLSFVAATQGSLAAVRVALGGIVTALTSPVVVGAGVVYALTEAKARAEGFKAAAKDAVAEATKPFDLTSYDGVSGAIKNAQTQVDILREKVKDRPPPWESADQWKRDTVALMEMEREVGRLKDSMSGVKWAPFGEMFNQAGSNAFRGMVDMIKSGIDPLNPAMDDLAGGLEGVGDAASGSAGKMSDFDKAMGILKDAATGAEEKLKALQTVMDGLKGPQNLLEAEIGFQESLDTLMKTLQESGPNFDILTEGGRKASGALIDAAEGAKGVAQALAAEQGITAGVASLQAYADTIAGIMRQAGVAEPEIARLLATLGLTPAQIDTLIKMTMEGPKPEDVKKEIEGLDQKHAEIVLEVIGAVEAGAAITEVADRPRIANVAIGTPGLPEAIGGVTELTQPRTQSTTVDTPNKDAKSGELDQVAGPRNQPTTITLPNKDSADQQLSDVARPRSASIVANAITGAAQAALNALERTYHANIVTTYQTVNAAGPNIAAAAEGGILETFAGGGMRLSERHVAQIAPAGAWRLWAEPETGGEAYIPLAESKRDRSLAIWEEVGRRFGAVQTTQGGGGSVMYNPQINVSIDGAGHLDPAALAGAVRSQVTAATAESFGRLLVELRSS